MSLHFVRSLYSLLIISHFVILSEFSFLTVKRTLTTGEGSPAPFRLHKCAGVKREIRKGEKRVRAWEKRGEERIY
jgi:hypothetical protein